MRALRRILIVVGWSIVVPASAFAQATLAGVVKDPSDAVLPGATVEASSDALIEKTRRAVTDDTGQYRITEREMAFTATPECPTCQRCR